MTLCERHARAHKANYKNSHEQDARANTKKSRANSGFHLYAIFLFLNWNIL